MKRKTGILLASIFLAIASAFAGGGTVHVHSYYRKDGTYVHAYDRAAPGTGSYSPSMYEPTTRTSSTSVRTTSSTTSYVPAVPDNATVHVHGYYRQDGTYVQEYVRSAPGMADT